MLRKIARCSAIAALLCLLAASAAFAMDGSAFLLKAGEARTLSVGSTEWQIHACNDVTSMGNLMVIFGDREPIEVRPGGCVWGRSDRLTLRNDSAAVIMGIFEVVGKHQA